MLRFVLIIQIFFSIMLQLRCVSSELNLQLNLAETALEILANDPELTNLWSYCYGPPIILGWWNSAEGSLSQSSTTLNLAADIEERKQAANFWITLNQQAFQSTPELRAATDLPVNFSPSSWDQDDAAISSSSSSSSSSIATAAAVLKLPKLIDVYCCNSRYRTACQIVFYKRPIQTASSSSSSSSSSGKSGSLQDISSVAPISFDPTQESPQSRDEALKQFTDLDFTIRQISASLLIDARLGEILERLRSLTPKALQQEMFMYGVIPFVDGDHAASESSSRLASPIKPFRKNSGNRWRTTSIDSNTQSNPDSMVSSKNSSTNSLDALASPTSSSAFASTLTTKLSSSPFREDTDDRSDTKSSTESANKINDESKSFEPVRSSDKEKSLRKSSSNIPKLVLNSIILVMWIVATSLHVFLNRPLSLSSFFSDSSNQASPMESSNSNSKSSSTANTLKSNSLFFQQLDRRLRDCLQWPSLWLFLSRQSSSISNSSSIASTTSKSRPRSSKYDEAAAATHMKLWGSVFRVGIDILAGLALWMWLTSPWRLLLPTNFLVSTSLASSVSTSASFHHLTNHSIPASTPHGSAVLLDALHYGGQILHLDVMQSRIRWLMIQPAGAKLNEQLSQALGSAVLVVLDGWNALTTILTPLEPFIIQTIALVGLGGFSLAVSLTADLLSLVTSHVDFLHFVFGLLYSNGLTALSALWRLFRGKKRNVLRSRIDSCDYDVDQLLLGTLLFVLVFFLFPTVAVYYFFFSLVRFLITLTQAALFSATFFFNSFPFFAVVVHFLHRGRRLPGGIWFEVLPDPQPHTSSRSSSILQGSASSANISSLAASFSTQQAGHLVVPPLFIPPPPPHPVASPTNIASNPPLASKSSLTGTVPQWLMDEHNELVSGGRPKPGTPSLAGPVAAAANSTSIPLVSSFFFARPLLAALPAQQRTSTYLVMRTREVPVGSLFFEFRSLLKRIYSHYNPAAMINTLMHGGRYPESPKLYDDDNKAAPTSLSSERTSPSSLQTISEFWSFLIQDFP